MTHNETERIDQMRSISETVKILGVSKSKVQRIVDKGLVSVEKDDRGWRMVSVAEVRELIEPSGVPNTPRRKTQGRIQSRLARPPRTMWEFIVVGLIVAVLGSLLNLAASLVTATPFWISELWSHYNQTTPARITDHPGEPFTAVSFVFDPDFVDQGEVVNRIQMTVCATTPYYYIDVHQVSPDPRPLIAQPRDLSQGCDDSNPALGVLNGEVIEIGIGAGESPEAAKPILVVYRLQRVGDDIRLVSIDGTPTTQGRP